MAFGQFGISLSYDQQKAGDWEELIAVSDSLGTLEHFGTVSFYYWWRPKNLRIEFLPEVGYRRNFGSIPNTPVTSMTHSIDLNANTNIYVFDLAGDCDCPTFSKQGNILTKGFFVEVSPGLSFRSYNIESSRNGELQESIEKSTGILGKIGLGAGLDIGVSDLVTLTPWIQHAWHFGANWENLSQWSPTQQVALEKSDLSYMRFGLRVGFRPDYKPFR